MADVIGTASARRGEGRTAELVLLAAAATVTTAALVSVEISQQRALIGDLAYLGAASLGVFGVAHLAVRRWAPHADPLLLPCTALLPGSGWS